MAKPDETPVLVTISNRDMSALRAYWTVMDISRGPEQTHFWDLRYGMVNRWQSEGVRSPHIRYGLALKRADGVNELEHAQEHGVFPGPPKTWNIEFRPGTFPEEFNPAYDEWMRSHMPEVAKIEDTAGQKKAWEYVRRNAPPEYLPNPENWPPERAVEELREILPKAVELYQSERPPIDWRPKGFVVSPPEEG
jgi:hypothetical protein